MPAVSSEAAGVFFSALNPKKVGLTLQVPIWMLYVIAVVALGAIFHGPLWQLGQRILTGNQERHSLYSEIHGLLEISVKQAAAMVEIRDSLREIAAKPYPTLDTKLIVEHLAVLQEIATRQFTAMDRVAAGVGVIVKNLPTIEEEELTQKYETRMADQIDKAVGLLGQIRDRADLESDARKETRSEIESNVRSIGQVVMAFKQQFDGIERESHFMDSVKILRQIGEAQAKILSQLETNDKRLADFVHSSRRIMRAIEGNGETDEDTELFEQAKEIMARAADKGVILTAEDALKRAREMRNFRMTG